MNYYNEKLKQGLEYQDFVSEVLYKIGLPIFNYSSEKYQIEFGENKLGVEIKFDNIFEKTGNIWIETKERRKIEGNYVPSGIYRNDNSWIYIIGNFNKFFIFSKKFLRQLHQSSKYKILENKRKTSIGFLLPKCEAIKYSDLVVSIFDGEILTDACLSHNGKGVINKDIREVGSNRSKIDFNKFV